MRLFRRILVPHDFSRQATRALQVAADLAREHRGRLLVLHAITPVYPAMPFPEAPALMAPQDLVAVERPRLEALVARTLRGRRAPRARCRVLMGDPLQCITDAAREVDSIVMSTSGRTGLSHVLMGSVAEKVVRHAPVPVLTVRPSRRQSGARPSARRRASGRRAVRR